MKNQSFNKLKNQWADILKQNLLYRSDYNYSENQVEIFRICLAIYALFSIITLLFDYHLLFAPDAFINWEVSNANAFWFELHPQKIVDFLHTDPENTIFWILMLYISALLALLIGIWTRLAAIIALVLFVCLSNVLASYGYGVDVYMTVSLFFLTLFPTGYALSFRPRSPYLNIATVRQISIRALQVYLSITYTSAGFEKAMMPTWWNGKFIYLMLSDPTVMTHNIVPLDWHYAFYATLGICVVFIESVYFIAVWIPITRSFIILSIIVMHIFISFCMGMPFFGFLLVLLNLVAWYPAILIDLHKIKSYAKKI